MHNLIVGVGQVSLFLRHAQSLKDKRQILKSLRQKLINLGFSVTECGFADNPKQGSLGFVYAGHNPGDVERVLEAGMRLFIGDLEIVSTQKDIFDYSFDKEGEFERVIRDE